MAYETTAAPWNQVNYKGIVEDIISDLAAHTGGETRTSEFVDISGTSKIFGAVYGDQAGTLYLDFSQDGVNVDHTETVTHTAGVADGGFVVDTIAHYVRARYVCGATPQTAFRLHVHGRVMS